MDFQTENYFSEAVVLSTAWLSTLGYLVGFAFPKIVCHIKDGDEQMHISVF